MILAVPLLAGTLATLVPAFGYFPALGGHTFGFDRFEAALNMPGFARAAWLSASTGLLATILSLMSAMALLAALAGSRFWPAVRALTPPFLAVPHAAVAIGFAFLIMPSGLFMRLGYWLAGSEAATPPDLLIVNDANGLALIAGLVLREMPFLLFTLIAAANQVDSGRQLRTASCLGYSGAQGWLFVLAPQLYRQIRLPILIVLAYGVSNADMAMVLGPTGPPTLTLLVLDWFRDPDLEYRFLGAAGAVWQVLIVLACFIVWTGLERSVGELHRMIVNGGRTTAFGWLARRLGIVIFWIGHGLLVLSLIALVLWSFAGAWRFPQLLPGSLSFAAWSQIGAGAAAAAATTFIVALASSTVALILVLLWLENSKAEYGGTAGHYRLALYLPLLIPQISFVFGLQLVMIWVRLDGSWTGVVLAHLVFVIPYTALVLMDPYRRLDPRFARTARSLGHTTLTVFLHVKLPMLARPIAFAWAVGFSVSCAQYLTTLFVGQGRVVTLSIEALALMNAGDRRLGAVMALLLAVQPLLCFMLAMLLPSLSYTQPMRQAARA